MEALEKVTTEAELKRTIRLEELETETLWDDALLRRAGRKLWAKVERFKKTAREEGFRIPKQLLNSLKSAKWRFFQANLHPNKRVDKWWAFNRLFLDLKKFLSSLKAEEEEEEEEEEENKSNYDTLGDCN